MYNMDLINGGHVGNQPAFPGQTYGSGNNRITLEQVDPSTFDDDSDDDDYPKNVKPGKKTKGRVKIKMEFIENKLRRYTTFSKRKTGIMKKAYELSTLTGTQVMLLVASETGHVYTFATRKLQPMITSESGKALIQTCLNSPDPPPMAPGQQQAVEQRMNPGGFEETELTYAVDDENGKLISIDGSTGLKPVYTLGPSSVTDNPIQTQQGVPQTQTVTALQQGHGAQIQGQVPTYQISQTPTSSVGNVATIVQQPVANSSQSTTKTANGAGISVQLPGLPPGIFLQPGTSFTIPVQTSQQPSSQASSSPQQQTVYRIPQQQQQIISSSPQTASAMTPSVLMYQTPQGIVYAPATGPIQEKTVFNFQQPAISVAQDSSGGQAANQQQQIITIPVPVSLANSQQVLQLSAADTSQIAELSQPSAAKKSRK